MKKIILALSILAVSCTKQVITSPTSQQQTAAKVEPLPVSGTTTDSLSRTPTIQPIRYNGSVVKFKR